MARLGMSEIGKQPKEKIASQFSTLIMKECRDILLKTVKGFREEFINQFTASPTGEILPEGTRFFNLRAGISYYVVEQKPSVRTLFFDEGSYTLALPYIVFIIVFQNSVCQQICVAFRNESLKSLDDMLYHTNLPNIGSYEGRDESEEGDSASTSGLVMCLGTNILGGSKPQVVEKAINCFWQRQFTDELDHYYRVMRNRDHHFSTLDTWQKHSKEDPSFILKIKWIPAIRLGKLLNTLGGEDYDDNVRKYIGNLHDAVWAKLVKVFADNELAVLFIQQLEVILKKFAEQLAAELALTVTDETIRRTVKIAVANSLTRVLQ